METIEKIKNNICKAIKQSELSQREIARRIGVSAQTVSDYVNKKSLPSLDTLANLCIILNVNPNIILCFHETCAI